MKSFKLFTAFGIPVKIDVSWFLVFALITWTLAAGYFPAVFPGQSTAAYLLMGVASALFLFGSVLLHELAHAIVGMRFGIPIGGITLFFFGGVSQMSEEPRSPRAEFSMAIAGPATSVVLGGLFLAAAFGIQAVGAEMIAQVLVYAGLINLILAAFNLVPGFPLDGGRVLRAALWRFMGNLERATRWASRAGKGVALLLMGWGAFNLFTGYFIGGLWLIFIGFFLLQAAEVGYRQVQLKEALRGVKVEELMVPNVTTVERGMSLQTLVYQLIFRTGHRLYPVVEDGRLIGVITFKQIRNVPRDEWPHRTVGEVMRTDLDNLTVSPDDEAVDALERMLRGGYGWFPVRRDHQLAGILARSDVMRLFQIKTDLGIHRKAAKVRREREAGHPEEVHHRP